MQHDANNRERPLTREHPPIKQTVVQGTPRDCSLVDEAIRRLVPETYLTDEALPYHGQAHPQIVWEHAKELIGRAAKYGIEVDQVALERAALTHDAFGHIPPSIFGFGSPEELAAHVTFNFLIAQGCSKEDALASARPVMATNPFIEPKTAEEIILRAADLWNIGGQYEDFKLASLALHKEAELRRGISIPFDGFITNSFTYLQLFVWRFLEVTPEARDSAGRSAWHIAAISNLAKMAEETRPINMNFRIVAELFLEDQNCSAQETTPDSRIFYIAMAEKEEKREDLLFTLRNANQTNTLSFVVPGNLSTLSLPDTFCDQLSLPFLSTELLREAERVLKPQGMLICK